MLTGRLTNLAANAEIDAHIRLLDGGWFDIYSGTQPDDADAPLSDDAHLLASLRFNTPAFNAGVDGVAVSRALESDPNAARTGKASWYRLFQADHKTAVEDGSIATEDANLVINAVLIQEHAEVTIDGFTLIASKR